MAVTNISFQTGVEKKQYKDSVQVDVKISLSLNLDNYKIKQLKIRTQIFVFGKVDFPHIPFRKKTIPPYPEIIHPNSDIFK